MLVKFIENNLHQEIQISSSRKTKVWPKNKLQQSVSIQEYLMNS